MCKSPEEQFQQRIDQVVYIEDSGFNCHVFELPGVGYFIGDTNDTTVTEERPYVEFDLYYCSYKQLRDMGNGKLSYEQVITGKHRLQTSIHYDFKGSATISDVTIYYFSKPNNDASVRVDHYPRFVYQDLDNIFALSVAGIEVARDIKNLALSGLRYIRALRSRVKSN